MNITLQANIVARKSTDEQFRLHRTFQPEGFAEKIWILFDGNELGKQLFDEVCEQVFHFIYEEAESSSESSVERFEYSMKELNRKIADEAVLPDDFLRKNSFVILLSVDTQIHFTTLGSAEVYFSRGGKVMQVSEGIATQSNSDQIFLNVASGELQDKDLLLFSTLRLLRYVTHAQLQDILRNPPAEILATLQDFIDQSEGGVTGCISVKGNPALPFEQGFDQDIQRGNGMARSSFASKIPFLSTPLKTPEFLKTIQNTVTQSMRQEILFLLGGIFLLVLLWFGITALSGGLTSNATEYKTVLSSVAEDINSASELIKNGDKAQALIRLELAENNAKDAFHNSSYQAEAQRYLKRISELRDSLSETTRMSGKFLVDISKDKSNEQLQGVFFYDSELYAFGKNNVFRILGAKIENILPLKESENVIKAAPMEKMKEVMMLTDKGNILSLSKTTVDYAKTEDPLSWKKSVDIGVFDKNLYLLSPENNDIYKYSYKAGRFSIPSSYNVDADLKGAISMAIDGNVYVLKSGGNLIKLFRGKQTSYELKNAPAEFSTVNQVFTLRDIDLLLFLDSQNKRVFVFKKDENDAIFDRQILIDSAETEVISGMWYDNSSNRILVSGKSKVYEVPLSK